MEAQMGQVKRLVTAPRRELTREQRELIDRMTDKQQQQHFAKHPDQISSAIDQSAVRIGDLANAYRSVSRRMCGDRD
jgi:hypothetical protein